MQYDDLAGAATDNIEARIRELREDGVDRELAFPNALLAMFGFPDKPMRERVFRIYNEYIADLQERSGGHFLGVGLINWWDAEGREADPGRTEIAWPQDVSAATQPGQRRRRRDDGLRVQRDAAGLGRDRGIRPAGHPSHR